MEIDPSKIDMSKSALHNMLNKEISGHMDKMDFLDLIILLSLQSKVNIDLLTGKTEELPDIFGVAYKNFIKGFAELDLIGRTFGMALIINEIHRRVLNDKNKQV